MSEHRRYVQMLARRRELSLREQDELHMHLEMCARCSTLASIYRREDELLRPLAWDHPAPVLRRRVFDAIERGTRPSRGERVRWLGRLALDLWPKRGLLHGLGAVVVIAGIVVNSPLMDYAGAQPANPAMPDRQSACTLQGWAILNYRRALTSPQQYRGHGSVILTTALTEAQTVMVQPQYYVFPLKPRLSFSCHGGPGIAIQVGINPKAGTELDAIGEQMPEVH